MTFKASLQPEWFPEDQYLFAKRYAIGVARHYEGRFEVGIEKMSEYGRPGYRAGFLLPKAENRMGYELKCEVVRATDPLPETEMEK